MTKHSSASVRPQTPHTNDQTRTRRRHREGRRQLSEDVRRRALAIINNKAIDSQIRGVIRYGYEINDPWTPDHVRRVEAGEYILDDLRPKSVTRS